jgi:hypothetical protein
MNKFLILILFFLSGFTSEKLIKTKIADGISASIPATLIPMTEEDLVQRYPSVRAPIAAFTNVDRNVDFSINTSATQWPDQDIAMAQKFFKSGIYNLFDRVDIIEEGIHPVHKKKMKQSEQSAVFRYSYIQYLVESDRTLVFSFNCPRDQKEQWQETARAMMKSLKVR